MPTLSQPIIDLTDQWQDICVARPACANVRVTLQNLEGGHTAFLCADAPSDALGPMVLEGRDSWDIVAPKIWVRGKGRASVTIA